jgi:prophage tail gpP-like protein
MHKVTLRTGTIEVGGWTTASIRKSLDQLADEFTFEITNQRVDNNGRLSVTQATAVQVRTAADELLEDDKCEILVDGKTMMTGFIDDHDFNYDANRARLVIAGRSSTGDLCDASAFRGSTKDADASRAKGQTVDRFVFRGATLAEIALELCAPFGISVLVTGSDDALSKKFERFRLEPGETRFEALSRASEMRGVVPITASDGSLAFVRSSGIATGAVIALGKNAVAGGIQRALRGRFSEYLFRGQTATDDTLNGKSAAQIHGSVEDGGVTRYRPYWVMGEGRANQDLGARAIWERNVRAGRSIRHRYTVEGWRDHKGNPWETNTLVKIEDDWANVDSEKLVCTLEFTLGEDYSTDIELVDRCAFDPAKTVKLPARISGDVSVGAIKILD